MIGEILYTPYKVFATIFIVGGFALITMYFILSFMCYSYVKLADQKAVKEIIDYIDKQGSVPTNLQAYDKINDRINTIKLKIEEPSIECESITVDESIQGYLGQPYTVEITRNITAFFTDIKVTTSGSTVNRGNLNPNNGSNYGARYELGAEFNKGGG